MVFYSSNKNKGLNSSESCNSMAKNRKYLQGQFIEQEGNILRIREEQLRAHQRGLRYTKDQFDHYTPANMGEAYGFFYYPGGKSIAEVLPQIRDGTETPSELILDLIEGVENLDTKNDSALVEIVQQAKRQNMSHVLKATLPNMGNRRTANFLGNIMNGIYSELYDKSEPFYAGIAYKRGEQYVFRRD